MVWVLWLACGGEPRVEPVVQRARPPAEPAPVATFPNGRSPQVLDARPAAFAHPSDGSCVGCHAEQAGAWAGSPHDLALGPAADALGRFDGQPVALAGLTAIPSETASERTLTVRDGGGTRTYRVRHSFGHDPLQQLLLEGDRGALLVAPIAWDVAGERWFDPAPDGVAADPADPLYWGGLFGTWNHMCATCHSTGVVEDFDAQTGSYGTRWTHEDVACQACHGEGPEVQTLARGQDQVAVCASCHSLRSPLAPGWVPGAPLLDHFTPALLDNPAYAADGGIQADREAFVWGSFQQSAMAAAGVRCSHCHEPHGTGLVAEGNGVCLQCHGSEFDAGDHDGGRACVDCHMPEQRYMGVDLRADHSFRVPGRSTGLPASLVLAGRAGEPGAAAGLLAAVGDSELSPFHRASALALLQRQAPQAGLAPVVASVADQRALVRWQAAALLGAWGQGSGLWAALDDPVRAVRFAAAKGLLSSGVAAPSAGAQAALDAVVGDLKASLAAEADEPASHLNLAVLLSVEGDAEGALAAAQTALRLAPEFPAAQEMVAALEGGGE